MFSFLKKKSKDQPIPTQENMAAETAKQKISDIQIYSMPDKFKKGAIASPGGTKKLGIAIMVIGAIVMVVGAVFLIRYIIGSGQSSKSTTQVPKEEVIQTQTVKEDEILDEVKTDEEMDCGAISGLASADNIFVNYENNSGLVCLGERIASNCGKAAATIETKDGILDFSILGLRQDNCIIQLDYPINLINYGGEIAEYAGTYLQCSYNIKGLTDLNYEPGRLAQYVYSQNTIDSISEETECTGSALATWRDLQTVAEEEEIELTPGVDSDSDGLTDLEENTIYTTNINNKDSDGDSYEDAAELSNFYNPSGGGRLWESSLISEYANASNGYKIFYPSAWQLEDKNNGELVHFFSGVDGFVQVLVEDNPDNKNLRDWYADLVASLPDLIIQPIQTTKGEMQVLYSVDGLAAYLTKQGDSSRIYIINYSPEGSETIEFISTFRMMVESLEKI